MSGDPTKSPRYQQALQKYRDKRWRLNNLYWIQDEAGRRVRFRMNRVQESLFSNLWFFNVVLKSRQHGITTLVCLYYLDDCLFRSNLEAAIIPHNLEDGKKIFRRKIKFPYENLPGWIRENRPDITSNKSELSFPNGSVIHVSASIRSGTVQRLLISEYGKICARYRDKAEEIQTGVLNAVHAGQTVVIESTAEGSEGDFFEKCKKARDAADRSLDLSPLDYRFHFFAWWEDPKNRLDPAHIQPSMELEKYFEDLQVKHGVTLTADQRAWYTKKHEDQGEAMLREHPSIPDEAFQASVEGVYFSDQLRKARRDGRICGVPHQDSVRVMTAWDFGVDDYTAIWFFQEVGREIHFIDYLENNGEGIGFYFERMDDLKKDRGYRYGTAYLPTDAKAREKRSGEGIIVDFDREGIEWELVNVADKQTAINTARRKFSDCWFDEARTETGVYHLDHYRKEPDLVNGGFKPRPKHDEHSHGADAFQIFALGHEFKTGGGSSFGMPGEGFGGELV